MMLVLQNTFLRPRRSRKLKRFVFKKWCDTAELLGTCNGHAFLTDDSLAKSISESDGLLIIPVGKLRPKRLHRHGCLGFTKGIFAPSARSSRAPNRLIVQTGPA